MERRLRHLKIHRRKKKTKKKLSLFVILLLLVLTGELMVWAFSTQFFLRPLTQELFSWVHDRTEAKGIQTTVLDFENVFWQLPDRVFWKSVFFRVHTTPKGPFREGVKGFFWAREIESKFQKLIFGEIRVVVRGGYFSAISPSNPGEQMEFFADHWQFIFHIPWWPLNRLRQRLGQFFDEVDRILKDGRTTVPIQLSGRVRFRLFGKQEECQVWVIKEGAEYRLVMNPNDFKRITEPYVEKVSDLEIELLARNPLLVPKALRITDEARDVASKAFEADKNVPKDAFRHVWWSYHLTKVFGPEFSKDLTDAHELGEATRDEVDYTEADHIMDYRNNRIGSDYALRGYSEDSLLERTMTDPGVFRSTKEVYLEMGIPEPS